jgi:Zn-dependent M28 family amino/carboxypeptidase
MFVRYFSRQGLESDPTPMDGRSDYASFTAVGIPAGGLFTGAEGIKTEEQEDIYGGQAGIAYDPCYHEACDTIANVNRRAINQMSNAIADGVWRLGSRRDPV